MPMLFKKITHHALNLLLPPLCLICDNAVGGAATLCPECWKNVPFIAPPFCACCGAVFDVPVGDGMLCGSCLLHPPAYHAARAAMIYDDNSRALILGFKHGDRTHAAQALATWMHRVGADCVANADYLMPVPLHRWRLFKRRYNQSSLLAHHVGKLSGKNVLPDLLRRIRATPTQGKMKRKERQDNVRGAFAIAPQHHTLIKDKKIVLIDDVLTTGATVEECARVLMKAGAKQVDVLTLARVNTTGVL